MAHLVKTRNGFRLLGSSVVFKLGAIPMNNDGERKPKGIRFLIYLFLWFLCSTFGNAARRVNDVIFMVSFPHSSQPVRPTPPLVDEIGVFPVFICQRHLFRICLISIGWWPQSHPAPVSLDSPSFKKPNDPSRPRRNSIGQCFFDVSTHAYWIALLFFFSPYFFQAFFYYYYYFSSPTLQRAAVNCVHKRGKRTEDVHTHTHGAGTKGGPFSHAADRVWRAYFVVFLISLATNLFADCDYARWWAPRWGQKWAGPCGV